MFSIVYYLKYIIAALNIYIVQRLITIVIGVDVNKASINTRNTNGGIHKMIGKIKMESKMKELRSCIRINGTQQLMFHPVMEWRLKARIKYGGGLR